MTAVLSTTYSDDYLFYLPITTWAWNKLGIDVMCFVPRQEGYNQYKTFGLITDMKWWHKGLNLQFVGFDAKKHKEATYAQCSRLYGAALQLFEDDEVLITGDIDMAVFNAEYFKQLDDREIHIVGTDLVPVGQYPMCYIAMRAKAWREVMRIKEEETHQDKLDQLLGHIECEHFRGNMWAKDQETAYNHIFLHEHVKHNRASPGTQFATRRADRDGWPEVIPPDIIDAHLPRPGYTEENFAKILNLFQSMYPNDDFTWMIDYRTKYVELL